MKYRIYAGASRDIVSEEDFAEYDNGLPYYDDYAELDIDDKLVDNINDLMSFEAFIYGEFDKAGLM